MTNSESRWTLEMLPMTVGRAGASPTRPILVSLEDRLRPATDLHVQGRSAAPPALATAKAGCYLATMTLKTIRPILALILTFSVLLGYMTPGARAAAMDARMAFTATEASVSMECDGCAGSESGMTDCACAMSCSSMVVIPAAEFVLPAFPPIVFDQIATPWGTDWMAPPIASPPKSVVQT